MALFNVKSVKQMAEPANFIAWFIFGVILTEVIMHLGNILFDQNWPIFRSGPYILLIVASAALLFAYAIMRRTWEGAFSKQAIALMIIEVIILVFLLTQLKELTQGTIFQTAAMQTRAMLGMG